MGRSQDVSNAQDAYSRISQSLPILRAWAIVWIVAYHLMGNTKGYLMWEEAVQTVSKGGLKNVVEFGLDLFISAGSTGVNVFLIISGFGLTASWWKRYGSWGVVQMPLMTFWKKRVFRIIPHFWAAVVIATLLLEYQFELADDQPEKAARRGVTLAPARGVPIVLKGKRKR